ncbi:hypothetical protein TNCV_34741 [Trichonephila clavipes]|nr:hypothetical protein TNCV_34741 [Trichonephila clavipes]
MGTPNIVKPKDGVCIAYKNQADKRTSRLCVRSCLHAEIVEVEIEVVSPSIVPSGNFAELNRTVTCMVLKANDRRTSCPCHDEFRGPRSDYVRQADIAFLSIKIIKTTVLYLLERVNINVALFSYMRAFGNGPRNFEPWSSDVDDTRSCTLFS